MKDVIIDSNIIVYIVKRELQVLQITVPDINYFISIITYMEVLGYSFNNIEERKYTEEIIKKIPLIYIDKTIADLVITIRSKMKIKLPDAIIAASAIINNCSLMTRNEDDFNNIEKLKIINPFK